LANTRDHFYQTCDRVIGELSATTRLSFCAIASLEQCAGTNPHDPDHTLKSILSEEELTQFFGNSMDEVMSRIKFCSLLYYGDDFDATDSNLDQYTAIFGTRSQLFGYYNMFLVDVVGCQPDL